MSNRVKSKPVVEKLQVDIQTAAHMLDYSYGVVYEMVKNGEIGSVKLGRLTRIPVEELKRWQEVNKNG